MSKPISVGFTYGTVTTSLQLSQLDTNFGTAFAAINDFATYGNYLVDSSGTPNQITVTIPAGTTFSYSTGVPLQVQIANTNTSTAVNINVSLLGNKAVLNADGSLPFVGQFATGQILPLLYDGTAFRTLTGKPTTFTSGTFTGTLTGCATAPTATFNYTIITNAMAIVECTSGLTATSNANTCTITGMPAVLNSARVVNVLLSNFVNFGANQPGAVVSPSGGVMTFLFPSAGTMTSNSWTTSGTKGLGANNSWTYSLV